MTGATRLTIGKLAEQGGVNIQTIRYYERRGLLPEPRRSPGGYRLYDVDAVIRLGFLICWPAIQESAWSMRSRPALPPRS